MKTLITLLIALVVIPATQASLMTVTNMPPVVDGDDIAQLTGTVDIGGNQGHVWNNRPRQGQGFTTGSNAGGYLLDAITIRAQVNQTGGTTAPMWEIRVGSVDGSDNFTAVRTETATGVFLPLSNGGNNFPNWVTWTLDTPLVLNPSTLYGFDVYPNGGGYISLNSNADPYNGGTAFSSGSPGSATYPVNPLTLHAGADRVFHLNLQAIPEPGTGSFLLVGAVALCAWRKRK